jgi:hypothetical protein
MSGYDFPIKHEIQSSLKNPGLLPPSRWGLRIVVERTRVVLQVRDYQLKSEYRLKRMAQ